MAARLTVVADVKAVLPAPDARARNTLIAAHLNRLEAGLAQTRTAVESLRNLLARRVTSLVIPAAELAIISHHGSLAGADLSYAKLGSYATTHQISVDGPLREYYLRGAGDTLDEAEWRTEIGWPIFRVDACGA